MSRLLEELPSNLVFLIPLLKRLKGQWHGLEIDSRRLTTISFTMQVEELSGKDIEKISSSSSSRDLSSDDGFLLTADQRQSAEKKLVRKLDRRVLPTIVAIYIMNYIDVCVYFNIWFTVHPCPLCRERP